MNSKLTSILLVTFVNVLGFVILLPVLPFIVEDFGGTATTYGLIIAAYPTFQFLAAPILGSLSDKYGRRPILLISQAGTLASWFVFGLSFFTPNISVLGLALPLWVIALARVTDGITGGNVSVANAFLADITKPKERTKFYGIMGAVVGIGLMIGPALGGLSNSTSIGYLGTVLLAIFVSFITLVWMYISLPESLDAANQSRDLELKFWDEINLFKKIKKYADNSNLSSLFLLRFFFAFAFNCYVSIIVLFIIDSFGLGTNQVGTLFLLLGLFLTFNQGFMSKKLSDKMGDLHTFYLGQVLMFVGYMLQIFVPNLLFFIVFAYIINLGFSVSFPTFKSLITNAVSPKQQGEISGIDESIIAVTGAFAPIIAGLTYDYVGRFSFGIFSLILLLPHLYILSQTGSILLRQKTS